MKLISVFAAIAFALGAAAGMARAQAPLLNDNDLLQQPLLRDLSIAPSIKETVGQAQDLPVLRDASRLRLRDLLRLHPNVLEAGPQGFPVVRGQIVAAAPSAEAIAQASALGLVLERREELPGLGETLVTWRVPPGLQTKRALQKLRAADPQGLFDYNHVYTESASATRPKATIASIPLAAAAVSKTPKLRIGLIDGGVAAHPALAGAIAEQRAFAGEEPLSSQHGTEVASLLAGQEGVFHGAASGAQLYVADVYGGAPDGGSSLAVIRALSWLAAERTPVINVSLVGPSNRILEKIVAGLIARGFVIVAAVGNDGPAAPPLYPAAYPGVVGVTAVDARNRVLPEAGRGPQVAFAAPGADMTAAASAQGYALVRGTSFAAPIVAGLLAQQVQSIDPKAVSAALAGLRAKALDLGPKGQDAIYGAGLVGADLRTPVALASR